MIGLFDSGVGGLAVLREVRRVLPDADLTFLADQAHAPYGMRPLEEVRELSASATAVLVERGATAVVIACNTASAAALGHLRSAHPGIGFVGMEPAVKPAAEATRSGRVAVLATVTTFDASVFDDLVGRFGEGITVIAHPCPGWAMAVENGWPDGALGPVADHLAPLVANGVDTFVIACTHYSFLNGVIREACPGVTVIDPAPAVARQTARIADRHGSGTTAYLTTGDPERFEGQVLRLLGEVVVAERVT